LTTWSVNGSLVGDSCVEPRSPAQDGWFILFVAAQANDAEVDHDGVADPDGRSGRLRPRVGADVHHVQIDQPNVLGNTLYLRFEHLTLLRLWSLMVNLRYSRPARESVPMMTLA
jgi:hypothetical protein